MLDFFCSHLDISCSGTWINSGAKGTTYREKNIFTRNTFFFSHLLSMPRCLVSQLLSVLLSIYHLTPAPPAPSATNPLTPIFPIKYIHSYRSSALHYPSLSSSLCLSNDAHYHTISISLSASYSGLSIVASQTWASYFSHASPPTTHTSNKQQLLGRKICCHGSVLERVTRCMGASDSW